MGKEKKENRFMKKNLIYNNFINSLNYVKDSRNYIFFVFFLFLVFIFLGFVFPKMFEEQLNQLLRDLLKQTEGLGMLGMIKFIINNNVKSSFFGLFLGIIFGIFPIIIISVNGFLLGFVINKAVMSEGIFILWKLFPHGIFEIPAVIISIGIGLRLGMFLFSLKDRKKGLASFVFSFFIFFFSLSFFSLVLSVFSVVDASVINSNSLLIKNNFFVFGYFIALFLLFFVSSYFGLSVFNKKEKDIIVKEFFNNVRKALIVFIFLVIPLLVIAGIIEGSLIVLMR